MASLNMGAFANRSECFKHPSDHLPTLPSKDLTMWPNRQHWDVEQLIVKFERFWKPAKGHESLLQAAPLACLAAFLVYENALMHSKLQNMLRHRPPHGRSCVHCSPSQAGSSSSASPHAHPVCNVKMDPEAEVPAPRCSIPHKV